MVMSGKLGSNIEQVILGKRNEHYSNVRANTRVFKLF
jgi:hypothetical protein